MNRARDPSQPVEHAVEAPPNLGSWAPETGGPAYSKGGHGPGERQPGFRRVEEQAPSEPAASQHGDERSAAEA